VLRKGEESPDKSCGGHRLLSESHLDRGRLTNGRKKKTPFARGGMKKRGGGHPTSPTSARADPKGRGEAAIAQGEERRKDHDGDRVLPLNDRRTKKKKKRENLVKEREGASGGDIINTSILDEERGEAISPLLAEREKKVSVTG